VYRLALIVVILCAALTACNGGGDTASISPTALLDEAAANLRATESFRVIIERSGADYLFVTEMGEVVFNRLEGQYAAPDVIQAQARVMRGRLPLDVEVFAEGEQQWVRGIFTNMEWQNTIFADGFNPQAIVGDQNTGLEAALDSLQEPVVVGEETLDDGTTVYHVAATAEGADVSALIANLIVMTGQVSVDVYVAKETRLPVRFVVVTPNTVNGEPSEATTWTIELYGFDEPAELAAPDVTAEPAA
jgi:hypothetical protein